MVSTHSQFIHTQSFYTLIVSTHSQFLHTHNFYILMVSTHSQFLHTHSFYTPIVSTHSQFLYTHGLYTLIVYTHSQFIHTHSLYTLIVYIHSQLPQRLLQVQLFEYPLRYLCFIQIPVMQVSSRKNYNLNRIQYFTTLTKKSLDNCFVQITTEPNSKNHT